MKLILLFLTIFLNFCLSQTVLESEVLFTGIIQPGTVQQFLVEALEGQAIYVKFAGNPNTADQQYLQFNPTTRIRQFTVVDPLTLFSIDSDISRGIFTEGVVCPSVVVTGSYLLEVATYSSQPQTFYVEAHTKNVSLNEQPVIEGDSCCGTSQSITGDVFTYEVDTNEIDSLMIIVNKAADSDPFGDPIMYIRYDTCPSSDKGPPVVNDYLLILEDIGTASITIDSSSSVPLRNGTLNIALQRRVVGTNTPPDFGINRYQIIVCTNGVCPEYTSIAPIGSSTSDASANTEIWFIRVVSFIWFTFLVIL